jgi:hypothetical protein
VEAKAAQATTKERAVQAAQAMVQASITAAGNGYQATGNRGGYQPAGNGDMVVECGYQATGKEYGYRVAGFGYVDLDTKSKL